MTPVLAGLGVAAGILVGAAILLGARRLLTRMTARLFASRPRRRHATAPSDTDWIYGDRTRRNGDRSADRSRQTDPEPGGAEVESRTQGIATLLGTTLLINYEATRRAEQVLEQAHRKAEEIMEATERKRAQVEREIAVGRSLLGEERSKLSAVILSALEEVQGAPVEELQSVSVNGEQATHGRDELEKLGKGSLRQDG
jgi:hypothetical protein